MNKPEVKSAKTLNLLDALHYIEHTHDIPGYKDEMMGWLADVIPGNDCFIYAYVDMYEEFDEPMSTYLKLLKDTFELHEGRILFEICW